MRTHRLARAIRRITVSEQGGLGRPERRQETAPPLEVRLRTTRSQAADAIDRERREERPLDPNNPDDVGGDGSGRFIRTTIAINSLPPPSPCPFPNLNVLGILLLDLEPSELYLCQRVCSHWRNQFSDMYSIRRCLDQHIVEKFPEITHKIRQQREIMLAMTDLRVACDENVPLAEMTRHLRRLQNFTLTQELRDLTGVDACVRWSARQIQQW